MAATGSRRVAQTLADLGRRDVIAAEDVLKALSFRQRAAAAIEGLPG